MSVRVRLMGAFTVEVDGRIADQGHFQRRSAAAVVKMLALAPKPSDASRADHGLTLADASVA